MLWKESKDKPSILWKIGFSVLTISISIKLICATKNQQPNKSEYFLIKWNPNIWNKKMYRHISKQSFKISIADSTNILWQFYFQIKKIESLKSCIRKKWIWKWIQMSYISKEICKEENKMLYKFTKATSKDSENTLKWEEDSWKRSTLPMKNTFSILNTCTQSSK